MVGSIIDIESTHYDAVAGELITAGFLSEDGFTIIQRVESSDTDFRVSVDKAMTTFKEPMYAFNKKCEEGFCRRRISHDLQLKGEATYIALVDEGLLDLYNSLCDPLFNEEIPHFWGTWSATKNPLFLSKIVRHNYCCLAKEYYLKLKRIDRLQNTNIIPFLSSAPIEKKYIRPALNLDII